MGLKRRGTSIRNERRVMRLVWTKAGVAALAVAAGVVLIAATDEERQRIKEAEEAVLKSNSPCMVCHIDFDEEELTVQHQKAEVMCAACHGACLAHMNDEMAATRPDRLFGRAEVDEMCLECHSEHEDQKAVDAFFKEWKGKRRPNGQLIMKGAICTDCHGRHVRLLPPMPQATPPPKGWIQLFNGKDLAGWKAVGNAKWTVEKGVLIGQQDDGQSGDLFTEETYDDFELMVTFKVLWPANSGIWFRMPKEGVGYQVDILELREGGAATGSIWSGETLVRVTDETALNREGWNTADITAVADHIKMTLNGVVVADVNDSSNLSGRIGFQVHAGERFANMKIMVREAKIRLLSAR